MKREIKFRAWDNEREKMANYVPILILCENSIWPHDLGYFHSSQQWTPDEGLITDFELMQFTGLKDKNGKEIYEGDVIKYGYILSTGTFDYIGYVHYATDRAMFYITKRGGEQFNECAITYKNINGKNQIFEVIGNIYENPELL